MTLMPMQRPPMGGIFGRRGAPDMGWPQQFPEQFPQSVPQQQAAPEAPKRWLDGGKFTTRDGIALALGAIGDAFTGNSNTAQMVGGAFEQQRRQKLVAQQAALQRQQGWEDWVAKKQYEAAHPDPVNNDTAQDYAFWQKHLPPEQFRQYVQNKVDPPQYRQGPDGQFYRISPTTPPPITAQDWDAGQPVGGPSQPAAGNFPSGSPLYPGGR